MLEEPAIVVKKIINKGSQQIWVTAAQQSACAGCLQKAACSSHALGSVLKRKPVRVDAAMPLDIGDHVLVCIDENHLLRAALTLYLLPLIALFIGAGLAESWLTATQYSDIGLAISAFASLMLALLFIKQTQPHCLPRPWISKKISQKIATAYERLGD